MSRSRGILRRLCVRTVAIQPQLVYAQAQAVDAITASTLRWTPQAGQSLGQCRAAGSRGVRPGWDLGRMEPMAAAGMRGKSEVTFPTSE